MSFLDQTLWLGIAYRVGWTLIHSLWQLAAVAVLMMIAMNLLHRAKPQIRYVIASIGLLLMAFLPIFSLAYFSPAPDGVTLNVELIEQGNAVADRDYVSSETADLPERVLGESIATTESPISQHLTNHVTDSLPSHFESAEVLPAEKSMVDTSLDLTGNESNGPAYFASLMPWLTLVWLAGVWGFGVVHARGFLVVHRLSRVGTIESQQHLQNRMQALADRLEVRPTIRLLESARVNTPLVIGWGRPVILVPLGMVTGMPAVQLDAVLLHELAHIRRHDYLVNALQVLIETLLFYHPAAWWLSRRIRTEREYCCDDIAAAGCGSHVDLAKALATLEAARLETPLALAASGPGKEKETMIRVRRLLEGSSYSSASSGASAAVLALLFACVVACFAMAGDDRGEKKSQRAKQQDNQREQRKADRKAERARKETKKSLGDAMARNDKSLQQDLVVYYSFDENTDEKVCDESGNGNHGKTVGNVKYEPSFKGRAARFTSNRTYVLSDASGLNMHGWKQVSVSMWIKTKRYTTYGRLISRGEVSGDGLSGIALQAGSGSSKASFSIGRQFQNGPAIWEKLYSSSLEPRAMDRINQWVHVVGTFDGDRLRFYVNGKLDREVEAGGHGLKLWDRPEHKLVIGNSSLKSRMAWGDKYFDGLVDEVKIWRRDLSAKEIKHIYGKGQKSISSRRSGDHSQYASPLLPETEIGVVISDTASATSDRNKVPMAIDSGNDAIRFESHPADDVKPGLVAVGAFDVEDLPTAKAVLERHRCGEIPPGHNELVGRLPLTLANFGTEGGSQLVVESFQRKGSQISANVKYIRKYPKDRVENTVYLQAKLPNNLPPGKYDVAFNFTSCFVGAKGEHVVERYGRSIPSMKCVFEVPVGVVNEGEDLDVNKIRFEGQQADKVEPGLTTVNHFPRWTLTSASEVLRCRRSGEIPAGHAELVGRLPTMLPQFNEAGGSRLIVSGFTRSGTNIVAKVHYVRSQAAQKRIPSAIYLRANLPDDLPSGKYHVTIRFTDSIDTGTGLLTVLNSLPTIPAMTCEFEVPGKSSDSTNASTNVPEHLLHWPGLSDRVAGEIVNAPEEDVRVAKGYAKFADKGKVHNGRRVTIMTAKRNYLLGEEVRVIHVLEAVKPGSEVFVMGPKAVYGEYIDGHCVTDNPPEAVRYDGRVLEGPAVDYNYVISKYNFKDLGEHTIRWKATGPLDGKGLESNVLRITVGADETAEDSAPGRLSNAERDILQNYHASSAMIQRAARICLRRQLTKAEIHKHVSDTMRSEATEDSITFYFAPSQWWTLTFDDDGKALSADITGKKLTRADIEGPAHADPGLPPDASTKVIVNTQTSLVDAVGGGFQDETWAYPTGLLPNEFPALTYVSGPTDKSLSPKGAWRKPIVLKHEDSDVVLQVNCYRRRDKPAAKVVKGAGTPFLELSEPDYQYEPREFHDLRAATAATENREVIAFRSGDVLYKVEARNGDAEARKKVAADAAETIWNARQTQ